MEEIEPYKSLILSQRHAGLCDTWSALDKRYYQKYRFNVRFYYGAPPYN